MKPQTTQFRCWLALFSLAASLQVTLAYYDPAAQRWINRDPVGEAGTSAIRMPSGPSNTHQLAAQAKAMLSAALRLTARVASGLRESVQLPTPASYTFVENAPSNFGDPFGLNIGIGPGYGCLPKDCNGVPGDCDEPCSKLACSLTCGVVGGLIGVWVCDALPGRYRQICRTAVIIGIPACISLCQNCTLP